jgi:hypothetical protein
MQEYGGKLFFSDIFLLQIRRCFPYDARFPSFFAFSEKEKDGRSRLLKFCIIVIGSRSNAFLEASSALPSGTPASERRPHICT